MALCRFFFILCFFFAKASFAIFSPDLQKIINQGQLVVAITAFDYPPFFYVDKNGKLDGFDIQIANGIGRALGVKVSFDRQSSSFNDIINKVDSERVNLGMGAITATLERGKTVNFTEPYMIINPVFLTNRLLELKIKNGLFQGPVVFAVAKNSAYEKFISENKNIFPKTIEDYKHGLSILGYENMNVGFDDLLQGNIYAIYTDDIYADYLLKNKKLSSLYLKKELVKSQKDPIALAVSWKNPNLLQWLNLYVRSIKYDGTIEVLEKHYFKDLKQ